MSLNYSKQDVGFVADVESKPKTDSMVIDQKVCLSAIEMETDSMLRDVLKLLDELGMHLIEKEWLCAERVDAPNSYSTNVMFNNMMAKDIKVGLQRIIEIIK